jgi:hypothetical protein
VRSIRLQCLEHLTDLGEDHLLPALRLVVVDREGDEFVLVIAQPGLEAALPPRRVGRAGVPSRAEEDVDGVVVDRLQVLLAGLDDVGDERSGQRQDRRGDELALGPFPAAPRRDRCPAAIW